MSASYIPPRMQGCVPYVIYEDVAKAIAFYKEALHATEQMRLEGPDGRIAHAQIVVSGTTIMMGSPMPGCASKAPTKEISSPVSFYVYVADVEQAFARAKRAGMSEIMPVKDMFWGDRTGAVADPFGYQWTLAQFVRRMSPDELKKGHNEMIKQMENAA